MDDHASSGRCVLEEQPRKLSQTMQQPKNIEPTFSIDRGGYPPPGEPQIEIQRSVNPNTSIEDYNRVMLEYTQRRMSTFLDMDYDDTSSVSHSSNSSVSTSGVLARQASSPTAEAPHYRRSHAGYKYVKQAGGNKTGY